MTGSTHEERVKALSWAIRQLDPGDKERFTALFDAYLICVKYDEQTFAEILAGGGSG